MAGVALRVGVVLTEPDVPRWHATAVSEIERLGFCNLTVFSSKGRVPGRRGPREVARQLLYDAYVRADRRWFGRADDALGRVPTDRCGDTGAHRIRLAGDPASDAGLAAIAAEQLDVLLCLAPEVPEDRLAGCARYGAWSLYAGGLRGRAGEAQLFWQMGDDEFVAPITLRAHTSADGERTIYRSVVESDRLSLHRSRCRAARRAAQLPARRLRDLRDRGWSAIASEAVHAERPPEPKCSHAAERGDGALPLARGRRSSPQAPRWTARREAVVHRVPAGRLRASHADRSPQPVASTPTRFSSSATAAASSSSRTTTGAAGAQPSATSSSTRAAAIARRGRPSSRIATSRTRSCSRTGMTSTCCPRPRVAGRSSSTGPCASRTSGRLTASC